MDLPGGVYWVVMGCIGGNKSHLFLCYVPLSDGYTSVSALEKGVGCLPLDSQLLAINDGGYIVTACIFQVLLVAGRYPQLSPGSSFKSLNGVNWSETL